MATGDVTDVVGRLRAVLPGGWFPSVGQYTEIVAGGAIGSFDIGVSHTGDAIVTTPSETPVLDGALTGIGSCFSWLYSLASYANLQTRLATATDVFLDIAAMDYFGGRIFRKPGQPDAAFSTKIRKEIVRERVTRRGLRQVLIDLTGRTPIIFEPALTTDTGGYGFQGMTQGSGLEYGGASVAGAGGYGSLQLGFQFFVTAYRATGGGIPGVAGLNTFSPGAGLDVPLTSNGDATTALTTEVPALFPGAAITKCTMTIGSGSHVAGFHSVSQTDAQQYGMALWVWLPAGTPITAATFQAESGSGATSGVLSANVAATNCWQRVGEIYTASGTSGNLVLRINAPSNGSIIYATCMRTNATGFALNSPGGYGVGAIEYGTLAMSQGQITDTDINDAIVSVLPAATTAWTSITN